MSVLPSLLWLCWAQLGSAPPRPQTRFKSAAPIFASQDPGWKTSTRGMYLIPWQRQMPRRPSQTEAHFKSWARGDRHHSAPLCWPVQVTLGSKRPWGRGVYISRGEVRGSEYPLDKDTVYCAASHVYMWSRELSFLPLLGKKSIENSLPPSIIPSCLNGEAGRGGPSHVGSLPGNLSACILPRLIVSSPPALW